MTGPPGTHTNTIPAGAATWSGGDGPRSSEPAAPATLTITAAPRPGPSLSKSFEPASVAVSDVSALRLVLANPGSTALTGVHLSDAYPSGLINAAAPVLSNSCGGSLSAPPGGGAVTLTGGTIAAGDSCTIDIAVTAATAGTYTNIVPAAAYGAAGAAPPAAGASATLAVTASSQAAPPSLAKAFDPPAIAANEQSRLRLTLGNNASTRLEGVYVLDEYPDGLRNAPEPRVTNTCGGTVTAAPGGDSLSLTGGSIGPLGTCTIGVDVAAAHPGRFTNAVPPASYGANDTRMPATTASARLTVAPVAPPMVRKSFDPPVVTAGETSVLSITLTNPGLSALQNVSFADDYPAGLANLSPPQWTSSCAGTILIHPDGDSVTASGITLQPGQSCTIFAPVTASMAGTYRNTIPAGSVTATNAPPNEQPATSVLRVTTTRRRAVSAP